MRNINFEFQIFPLLRDIPNFSIIGALLPREWVFDLAQAREVERIYPNRIKYVLRYPTVPDEGIFRIPTGIFGDKINITTTLYTKKLIGADIANQKGYYGSGIKVAVIDTGASKTHEMTRHVFIDSVMVQKHDENGHGEWCTSCIVGRRGIDDILSRRIGRQIVCEGIAPNARAYAIKALGYVVGVGSDDSIMKALELAIYEYNVDVISMSLGGKSEEEREEDDPYYEIMQIAVDRGIVPVVAAGNDGKPNSINSPGCLSNVLTVGAYDPIRGTLAPFSSRGATNWGSIKPDCVAPGVNIHSATVGLLDKAGDSKKNRYSPLSGTSMATPHVAGLVVLMKQAFFQAMGRPLYLYEIMNMLAELGHEKNNEDGYGIITWQMFEEWMETEYGVKV